MYHRNGGALALDILYRNPVAGAAHGVAAALDWRLVAIASFLVVSLCLKRGYTEESLFVLRGLGIQTSTSSPTFFSTSTTTFIPTTQIQDIVIHEAFKGLEVRFYLAIIVEGATEAVVVFPVRVIDCSYRQTYWPHQADFVTSTYCLSARFLKRFGEALECACMTVEAKNAVSLRSSLFTSFLTIPS